MNQTSRRLALLRVPVLMPVLALALALTATSAKAATFSFSGLGLMVPDGNPAGLASTQEVDSDIISIESVTLTVRLTGTFNGDLYLYLKKDTGFTVLLNRVGKNGPGAGYGDDGFDITFSDSAPAGDIHTYQTTLTPPPGSPLNGTWQPDGRLSDPDSVTSTDSRSALLSSFNGLPASGSWTLFAADLNSGDLHTLQSWSLTLTGTIPEPSTSTSLLAMAALATLPRRRLRGSEPFHRA